jgi:hypothetical protein
MILEHSLLHEVPSAAHVPTTETEWAQFLFEI